MLEMRFIAEYSKESGFASVAENTPAWFASHVLAKGTKALTTKYTKTASGAVRTNEKFERRVGVGEWN